MRSQTIVNNIFDKKFSYLLITKKDHLMRIFRVPQK
jgi:hypothetical protein